MMLTRGEADRARILEPEDGYKKRVTCGELSSCVESVGRVY